MMDLLINRKWNTVTLIELAPQSVNFRNKVVGRPLFDQSIFSFFFVTPYLAMTA